MTRPVRTAVLVLIVTLSAAPAMAQTHAENLALGKAIFTRDCSLCHDDSPRLLNDNGPSLFNVVGRHVGSVAGYGDYSPALQQAGAKGDRWTADRLDRFLSGPEAMYSGTSMPMAFDDPRMRKAIITYLKTLKPEN
jgi:cytochrome c